ncbi:MAG: DUF1573 domain-containing protein [Lewinellaceae bacterium]|nr:DUF1573 domain-containing protein [Lewinellaceae bacterium]
MVTTILFFLQILWTSAPALDETSMVKWLEPTSYDFGDMEQGVPQTVVFTWKNISQVPLTLETVRTTCGCTAAEWTQEPVQPGQTGTVSIEYDTYNSGAFRKKIRVFFNQQKKAEILWVSGNVK